MTSPTASRDVTPPKMGPPFLRLHAWPYRLEMAVGTIVLLLVLFYWRLVVVGDLNVLEVIFWLLFPDLAAFIPIGIASSRRGGGWPSWGASLYNAFHTLLTWALVFGIWSLAAGTIHWALLGWAVHITGDRTAGYYLRASPTTPA